MADSYVGPIDEERFSEIVADPATGSDEPWRVHRSVCNCDVGLWLDGEIHGDGMTLSSDDSVIPIQSMVGTDDVYREPHLGEAEPRLFTATGASG